MKNCKLVSIDLAKNVFQVCLFDHASNKVISNRKVTRSKFLDYLRRLPLEATLAMESCASSHHWARELVKMGFQKVILVPAQHVKPFVGKQKNDANDARAIGEAALRPNLHSVPIKSIEQQDLKVLRNSRLRIVRERTRLVNHLRGHCAEYGVVLPTSINVFRRRIPEVIECGDNQLSCIMREHLQEGYEELISLDQRIAELDKRICQLCKSRDDYKRLMAIPGIGPQNASAMISEIGDGSQFESGRQYAAYCGLVPRQHSSGGRVINGGITKTGNRELRTLLVHSARSQIRYITNRDDPLSRWVQALIARRGKNKATVALANKMARVCWAVLRYGQAYQLDLMSSKAQPA